MIHILQFYEYVDFNFLSFGEQQIFIEMSLVRFLNVDCFILVLKAMHIIYHSASVQTMHVYIIYTAGLCCSMSIIIC